MIEIGMHKIYKNFGYKQVLKDINFEILTGDRVGIVGKNGSGKSTVFKMIMKKNSLIQEILLFANKLLLAI